MNIGEILIWESSNLLLLIPVVIGLVMLVRWFQGRAVAPAALLDILDASQILSLTPLIAWWKNASFSREPHKRYKAVA